MDKQQQSIVNIQNVGTPVNASSWLQARTSQSSTNIVSSSAVKGSIMQQSASRSAHVLPLSGGNDRWKAPGGPTTANAAHRRSSTAVGGQAGYFQRSNASMGNQIGNTLTEVDEDRATSPDHHHTQQRSETQPPPLFQVFGNGRNHGNRSFSFSVGQTGDEASSPVNQTTFRGREPSFTDGPPPGFASQQYSISTPAFQNTSQLRRESTSSTSDEHPYSVEEEEMQRARFSQRIQSRSHSYAQILSEMSPEMVEEMLIAIQHQQKIHHQQAQKAHHQSQRFVPTHSQNWLDGAENEMRLQSNAVPAGRRHSTLPSGSTIDETTDLAAQYFSQDPALMERRHSYAAAMAHPPPTAAMNRITISNDQDMPRDFAEQYGNLVDDVITPSASEFSRSVKADTKSEQNGSHKTGEPLLYIVEFKGGRNDFFYLPKTSPLKQVKVGDLLLVEADRGQDLGKCVACVSSSSPLPASLHLSNGMTHDDVSNIMSGSTNVKPKAIFSKASKDEVRLLLDKARDEAKTLSICQVKAKQKNLPMEVVDVEYQWDRKKLTLYFCAENRIDFREYVRDLFKIYKTRIWMCAIERSGPGIRVLVQQ